HSSTNTFAILLRRCPQQARAQACHQVRVHDAGTFKEDRRTAIFAPFSALSLGKRVGKLVDGRRGCAAFAPRCNITPYPSKQAAMIEAETRLPQTDREAADR